jgi:hypothetical protein
MITFDKEKLLKVKTITAEDHNNQKLFLNMTDLILGTVSNQLCFLTADGKFIPIGRISEIKELFEKD